MKRTPLYCLVIVAVFFSLSVCRPVVGDMILSEYLGGTSGGTVTVSNLPFMTYVTNGWGGVGVDTAGDWTAGALIDFSDTDPFDYGIGMHANSEIYFHLDEFRAIEDFDGFSAVIGIDQTGSGGAVFKVLLDDEVVSEWTIESVNDASVPIFVPIADESTMTLSTTVYPGWGGNHSAWADARLTAVPEPSTLVLLSIGAMALLYFCRR